MSDKTTEIQNREGVLGTEKNADGSPLQEVRKDGEPTHEIHNIETVFVTERNADGTPVKEVIATA
jgi:hypothetical protein